VSGDNVSGLNPQSCPSHPKGVDRRCCVGDYGEYPTQHDKCTQKDSFVDFEICFVPTKLSILLQ